MTFLNNYTLHLAKKNFYHRPHYRDQTVPERCFIAHCSLLMTFICFRHSFISTQSVNSTNITVHILQCVTVLNQDNMQHFPQVPLQHHFHTQGCISQTVRSDLKVATVLMCWYICMCIEYHQFTFRCLREERQSGSHITLYYHVKGLICAY